MTYVCCDEKRRAAVQLDGSLNGIDWLEVLSSDAPEGLPEDRDLRQRTLMVRLLQRVPESFGPGNVRISGGERVRGIGVSWAAAASAPPEDEISEAEREYFAALEDADRVLLVRTDRAGDFSTYRLRLVASTTDDSRPDDFDPQLVEVAFSFKVECRSEFDCMRTRVCKEDPASVPELDYLAKDYASFRTLMLDRLSRLVPGWRERSAADLGVTLVELLAYAADHLSYWQDAVATEAYLETARRRTSLRRHALLVDYAVHEGCNARAWVQVRVNADGVMLSPGSARFYTRLPGTSDRIAPGSLEEQKALHEAPLVFEPMHEATLHSAHNEMPFYTWGDTRCCLAKGSVVATLRGHFPNLAPGDVLVFKEQRGPLDDVPEDADPARRHVVRLTRVQAMGGASGRAMAEPLSDPLSGTEITEIEWHEADALPFALCLSSRTDEEHGSTLVEDVSVALGNIVLADHGRTIEREELGSVPEPRLHFPPPRNESRCDPDEPAAVPARFRPRLAERPLTRVGQVSKATVVDGVAKTLSITFDPDAPASAAMHWEMSRVLPDLSLESENDTPGAATEPWFAKRDLLDSRSIDQDFVVETEHDGTATLRFGDGVHGRRPEARSRFTARYRVGNGIAGNVGAEAIAHVVTDDGRIESVTNPMAARGGTEPESVEQVRRHAPQAFRRQERAVTPRDYAESTERLDGVQRAAASFRWTGSWHTVFVTVDREEGRSLDEEFRQTVVDHLERYRMAGHDLHVDEPAYVSLEIDVLVCVEPEHFRSDVRRALLEVLGSGTLEDGRRGVFHPDNLTFGQTVFLSPIYAAARAVPGVASVQVTRFHRQGQDDPRPLADELMRLGSLEIPRLDNDPNYPEHGVLRLELHGGK